MDLDRYRLPRTVEPSRYDLTIEPDDQSSTFTGGVDVAVTVNEPVTAIVLNAVELAIPGGSFTSVHGGRRIDETAPVGAGVGDRAAGRDGSGRRRRGAPAGRPRARQGQAHAIRARGRRVLDAVLSGLLRDPVPRREDGFHRPSRLRPGRDGEH